MKRLVLYILIVAAATATGCKKKENEYLINAAAYLNDQFADAYIGFAPASRTEIIKNAASVKDFFNSNPKFYGTGYRYSEYLPEGDYLIIIQLRNPTAMKGTYTYRQVSNRGDGSTDNVMMFENDNTADRYQVWQNKY